MFRHGPWGVRHITARSWMIHVTTPAKTTKLCRRLLKTNIFCAYILKLSSAKYSVHNHHSLSNHPTSSPSFSRHSSSKTEECVPPSNSNLVIAIINGSKLTLPAATAKDSVPAPLSTAVHEPEQQPIRNSIQLPKMIAPGTV